jgi:MFS family permease
MLVRKGGKVCMLRVCSNLPLSSSAAAASIAARKTVENRAGLILFLLVISVAVNYIDRGALSVSATLISRDLSLAPEQMGLLLSAFFWSYALLQLLGGWLVDRFSVKVVFALSYAIWGVATMCTGLVATFPALFAARLVLGAGESVAYPAYSRILVYSFPEQRRGLANALIDVGAKAGPALSTLIGGLLVNEIGWRAVFLALGAGSLIWLLPWSIWGPKDDIKAGEARPVTVSFGELLKCRQVWVTSFAMFCLGYTWYFLLTWLPTYLVKERGMSLKEMAILGSAPFWVMAVATMSGGWLSDRFIRRGASPTIVRRTFCVVGLIACAAMLLPSGMVATPTAAVLLITGACFAFGVYTSNVWAITQTLAGPGAAGKWSGVQNAVGNLGGVASPIISGVIVSRVGSFQWAFITAALLLVLGALSYLFLLGPLRPVVWKTESK